MVRLQVDAGCGLEGVEFQGSRSAVARLVHWAARSTLCSSACLCRSLCQVRVLLFGRCVAGGAELQRRHPGVPYRRLASVAGGWGAGCAQGAGGRAPAAARPALHCPLRACKPKPVDHPGCSRCCAASLRAASAGGAPAHRAGLGRRRHQDVGAEQRAPRYCVPCAVERAGLQAWLGAVRPAAAWGRGTHPPCSLRPVGVPPPHLPALPPPQVDNSGGEGAPLDPSLMALV